MIDVHMADDDALQLLTHLKRYAQLFETSSGKMTVKELAHDLASSMYDQRNTDKAVEILSEIRWQ